MNSKSFGKWAFLIGLVIAVLASFITAGASYVPFALLVLGLIVGFLNVKDKDSTKFLIALIALIILGVGSVNALSILSWGSLQTYLQTILGNFITFVAAAGLIVALKTVIEVSEKK